MIVQTCQGCAESYTGHDKVNYCRVSISFAGLKCSIEAAEGCEKFVPKEVEPAGGFVCCDDPARGE